MKVTFAPRGILQIDDARMMFPNFEGREEKYNHRGDKNFVLAIDERELYAEEVKSLMERYPYFELEDGMMLHDVLMALGWNVRIKPPREEGDSYFITLGVKVKFNDRGPDVYLKSGDNPVLELDEEGAGCLDNMDILSVDMDIRPYDWEINGKEGRTAYLQSIHVVQRVNRFAQRYEN